MNALSRNEIIAVALAVVAVASLFWWLVFVPKAPVEEVATDVGEPETLMRDSSGFTVIMLKAGDLAGATVSAGDFVLVTVHYDLWLGDGSLIDSSRDRKRPYSFLYGSGAVIEGWEKGLVGMKVGEIRRIIVPPELGYGSVEGHPLQNETLLFEVELLDVEAPALERR